MNIIGGNPLLQFAQKISSESSIGRVRSIDSMLNDYRSASSQQINMILKMYVIWTICRRVVKLEMCSTDGAVGRFVKSSTTPYSFTKSTFSFRMIHFGVASWMQEFHNDSKTFQSTSAAPDAKFEEAFSRCTILDTQPRMHECKFICILNVRVDISHWTWLFLAFNSDCVVDHGQDVQNEWQSEFNHTAEVNLQTIGLDLHRHFDEAFEEALSKARSPSHLSSSTEYLTTFEDAFEHPSASKFASSITELGDDQWSAEFKKVAADQAPSVDAALIEEIPALSSHDQDFHGIWNQVTSEATEEDSVRLFDQPEADGGGWIDDFDDFGGGVEGQSMKDFEIAPYEFEPENPFSSHAHPLDEGLRLFDGGGSLSSAALAFEAAVQLDADNAAAWSLLGRCQAENEKELPAISALDRAIQLNPQDTNAIMVSFYLISPAR